MPLPYNAVTQFQGGAQFAINGWMADWMADPVVVPIDEWYRPGDLTLQMPGAKLISRVSVPVHPAGARAFGGTFQFDELTGIVLQCQRAMWEFGTKANTFRMAEWDIGSFSMAPNSMAIELGNVTGYALVALLNGAFGGVPVDRNLVRISNGETMICTDQIYGGSLAVLPSASITAWVTSTAYIAGQKVTSNGNVYKAGSSATSGATAPSGTTTSSDGTITWTYLMAATMQAQKLVNPAMPGFMSGSSWYNAHENFAITAENIIAAIVNQQTRPAMNGVELGLGDEGIEVWVPYASKERTRQLLEIFRQLPGTGATGATPVQVPITGGGSQVIYSVQDNPVFGRAKVRAITGLRPDFWCVVSPRPQPRPQYSLFLNPQGGKTGKYAINRDAAAMQADSVPLVWVKVWDENSPMFAGTMKGCSAGDIGVSMLKNEGFAFGSGMLIDVCSTGYMT